MFLLLLLPLTITSCGGDDKDEPESTVNDPEGTVLVYLQHEDWLELCRFNGPGYSVGMWVVVNESNNFSTVNGEIASVGKVKGLSGIKSLPKSGWTNQAAIVPGNGYVAMDSYNNQVAYARFYVVDFITSTDGGILGAIVKYQRGWTPDK